MGGREAPGRAGRAAATVVAVVLGVGTSAAAMLGAAVYASDPGGMPRVVGAPSPTATAQVLPGMADSPQDPAGATAAPASVVTPVRVRIPAIGVDSGLESLALDGGGRIEAPRVVSEAGWYSAGIVPGAVGPAVIAGHVDSATGPGVFLHLGQLVPGASVFVDRSDGSSVEFTVERSVDYAKAAFPTSQVYGATPDAQLRLITCDGFFDPAVGHYVDNLVIYASRTIG